jgi:hypothetical protein
VVFRSRMEERRMSEGASRVPSRPLTSPNALGAGRLPNAERYRGSRPALEVTPERVARLDSRMGLGFPRAGHGRKEPHDPRRLHRRHRRYCRRDHRCPRRADLHRSSRGPKAPLRHGKAGARLRRTARQRETSEGRAASRMPGRLPLRAGAGRLGSAATRRPRRIGGKRRCPDSP